MTLKDLQQKIGDTAVRHYNKTIWTYDSQMTAWAPAQLILHTSARRTA